MHLSRGDSQVVVSISVATGTAAVRVDTPVWHIVWEAVPKL